MSEFEPSQAAKAFFNEVQAATGNYYKNHWHLTRALKRRGITWELLNNPDSRANALAVASDHARQRLAEKQTR